MCDKCTFRYGDLDFCKEHRKELKQKLVEGSKVVKDKFNEQKGKTVETFKSGVKVTKEKLVELSEQYKNKIAQLTARSEVITPIENMINDYAKSGLTVDEYFKQKQISDYLIEVLVSYADSVDKYKENNNRRGSK